MLPVSVASVTDTQRQGVFFTHLHMVSCNIPACSHYDKLYNLCVVKIINWYALLPVYSPIFNWGNIHRCKAMYEIARTIIMCSS